MPRAKNASDLAARCTSRAVFKEAQKHRARVTTFN